MGAGIPGGRTFLPLPILAALLFMVLALFGSYVPRATAPTSPDFVPNVAQLWAQAQSGVLEPDTGYRASDAIYNVTVEDRVYYSDLLVRFASMPGTPIRMEGMGGVFDLEELRGWSGVEAYFYYTTDEGLMLVWLMEA